jgi:cytochrome o ubiquinol oxidase subunit 2
MRSKLPALKLLPALAPLLALTGCNPGDYRLFNPLSQVAHVQWWATLFEAGIMSIIIVPTLILIGWFTWRYRKGANAKYDPNWSHSLTLEVLVWGVPLIVVVICGVISIRTTRDVDPYTPAVLASHPSTQAPLNIDVITTDWQWLFIYPDQHVAAVDQLVIPENRIVHLRLTSTSVVNDFFIPQIATMIDVMPGMRTENVFDAPKAGSFTGFSADFSGAGFSWMQFDTRVVTEGDFEAWVAKAASSPTQLTYQEFTKLAQPTVNEDAKPSYFSNPAPNLFETVVTAAQAGVVYPVSDRETKEVANLEEQGGAPAAASK